MNIGFPKSLNHTDIKERLLDRRRELIDHSNSSVSSRNTVTLDQQSVGRLSRQDALQQQAMARAQEQRRKIELTRIDSALLSLESGEYGWCAECGEAIASNRLDIDPLALLCIACAQ